MNSLELNVEKSLISKTSTSAIRVRQDKRWVWESRPNACHEMVLSAGLHTLNSYESAWWLILAY